MDLVIGPTASLSPSRPVQRAVDSPRPSPAQPAGPAGASGDRASYTSGIGITLSPQALLALQASTATAAGASGAKAQAAERTQVPDHASATDAGDSGLAMSGPERQHADLSGGLAAYRLAEAVDQSGHGGRSGGVDLAA